ncbi:hypothetical protein OIN60_09260 [Paenibacillus sp. P96]|uniref:Uncharacterized protein n=1 Tax=Paenibacillus zeirhizosphaerae TaxID=2987519 RepID=A0ABT9FR98_9BACL|nr:hypothetical protein [Paenibacillus sp. P96]MDP4096957.1 hypothetical protein [Paenibacillus sp. P96]
MSQSVRHVIESLSYQFSRMGLVSIPQSAGILDQCAVEQLDSRIFAAMKKA